MKTINNIIALSFLVLMCQNAISRMVCPPDSSYSYKILKSDGRFTLGVDFKKIMYGYPFPYSTSHFVVKVDGEYLTNAKYLSVFSSFYYETELIERRFLWIFKLKPKVKRTLHQLAESPVKYLQDTLFVSGSALSSLKTEISFDYKDVTIYQKLTPVDENLQEVPAGRYGQYYRVDYVIVNRSNKSKKVGLLVLFDTMIDNNDACRIDPFPSDKPAEMFRGKEGSVSKEIICSRGYEKHFFKGNIPRRLLLYKDDKKGIKDLTGDLILSKEKAVLPDMVCIGPWPDYNLVLWTPVINATNKYKDSGVLLRWDEKEAAPSSVTRYTTYYGLYNTGNLQLVVSDPEKMASFNAAEPEIFRGDKTTLKWQVTLQNQMKVKLGILTNEGKKNKIIYIGNEHPERGELVVSPIDNRTYVMEVYDGRKLVGSLFADVTVKIRKEESDGRFTMGSRTGMPVMYGYPFNFPSSYFILSIDGKYASNNPEIGHGAEYIKGISWLEKAGNNTICHQTVYSYGGLDIVQRLIPAGKERDLHSWIPGEFFIKANDELVPASIALQPLNSNGVTFYRVEYEIKNLSGETMNNVGLSLVSDIMIRGKDGGSLYSGGRDAIAANVIYTGNKVPDMIADSKITDSISLMFRFPEQKIQRPVKFCLSYPSFLNDLVFDPEKATQDYCEDAAVLFAWEPGTMKNNEKSTCAVFIGSMLDIPQIHFNNLEKQNSISVFFNTGKSFLSRENISKITAAVKSTNYSCIFIEGNCDRQGADKTNHHLSEDRALEVKKALVKAGADPEKILIKMSGDIKADKRIEKNSLDRKVDISFWQSGENPRQVCK
ncbi:MAG: OmpA family protein [Bacteroidia bacterium]|nr:OmpA family protein [Bacteroidia bacterium]